MDYKDCIPYEHAYKITDLFRRMRAQQTQKPTKEDFLQLLGLASASPYNLCMYTDSSNKTSYLYVIDAKKYMLAKLKYAI